MIIKDPEASEWRRHHKHEVEGQIKRFLDRAYRKSQSFKAAQSKYSGIAVFCSWQRKLPLEVLNEIKEGKASPYKLLDDYVTYLVIDAKTAPFTTKNYLSAVKRWLKFEEVEILDDKLKDIVDLPRQYAITSDRVPTPEELRDAVLVSKLRGKALITTLTSSGMRIGEALSLTVGDTDLQSVPPRIHLRAEVTKDRQERWCFISDEAAGFLREYLRGRISEKECFLFLGRHQGIDDKGATYETRQKGKPIGKFENRPISYWDADFLFTTALKNAGLTEKDRNGRDRIHIHCLRKYYFTRMLAILGRELTEALMGHKEYLDSAYRRYTVDELAKQYLKGMDAVTVLSTKPVSREEMDKQIELGNYKFYIANSSLGESPERILRRAENEKGRTLVLEEQLSLFKSEYGAIKQQEATLLEEGTTRVFEGSKAEQRRVSEEELDAFLSSGWSFLATLPSGRVLIQK